MQTVTNIGCASSIENLLNAAFELPEALAAAGASEAEVRKAALPTVRILRAIARDERADLLEANEMLNDGISAAECADIVGTEIVEAVLALRAAAGLLHAAEAAHSLS